MATLLLCSGGSALQYLETLELKSFAAPLTMTVLDERFTSDPDVSNFTQLSQTAFFKKAKASVIDTRPQAGETLDGCALRFELALRGWWAANPEGNVAVIMGIGADGHTAGIAPMPDDPGTFENLFNNPSRWVVGYDAGARLPHPERVTVTLPFLRTVVDHATIYAKRAGKEAALAAVDADEGSLAATPARVVHELKSIEWNLL